jgi:hypothetical protein
MQYREANHEDGTSDTHPVGLMEGWCAGLENNSNGTMKGRALTWSCSKSVPMGLSGCSSDFDLESGGVALALEDADSK